MQITGGHLTYCTNIHAGESWEDHFAEIRQHFPVIKEKVSPDKPMGIGLRLSNNACVDLIQDDNLQSFKAWLKEHEAYVFTMNGFPYGGFHHTIVKDQVHAPDWTTYHRYDYTLQLFHILKELLPAGMDGGVSTSPLSYRHWFSDDTIGEVKEIATSNIIAIVEYLITVRRSTGQILHLDIEPEPDGILETGEEFISWYESVLLPAGIDSISNTFSVSQYEAEALIKDHINLCYDVCHFAIGYESHEDVIKELYEYGIKIGKFQISAALKADFSGGSKEEISTAFNKYNEPTYLHQVVARTGDRQRIRYRDLPQALKDIDHPGVKEWRAHFHVPVFAQYDGVVKSTQSDITEILELQKKHALTNHLEVETYTWEVLPDALKLPVDQSIIRELLWVKDQLV